LPDRADQELARDRDVERDAVPELPEGPGEGPERSPVGGDAEGDGPQQRQRREQHDEADRCGDGGVEGGEERDEEALHSDSRLRRVADEALGARVGAATR
jgi:hypothetical protein